eukprot:COSAG02_NODE_11649_length_1681_cov_2.207332_1_plen_122_part_00
MGRIGRWNLCVCLSSIREQPAPGDHAAMSGVRCAMQLCLTPLPPSNKFSVAECLALAEKQDTEREDAAEADPVEGILERIAKSAAGVTQAVGECSLDLTLLKQYASAARLGLVVPLLMYPV